MDLPFVGLGTWLLKGKECTNTVKEALHIGYRHIDTAYAYENHKAIKEGIKDFPREELFITTKLALEQVDFKTVKNSVEKACDAALSELGLDYIDLYLIHWPDHELPHHLVFQEMQILKEKQKVKFIGVSNFTIHHLQEYEKLKLHPSVNQVEFHPYLYQQELLQYCQAHGIRIVSYRPFGKGKLLTVPLLQEISLQYNKTASQVILRWLIQKKIPVIPKAASGKHLKENLDVFDFVLTNTDVAKIDALNKNIRFCQPEHKEHSY